MRRSLICILIFLIFVPFLFKEVQAQPRLIIAINFRITFNSDGTAIVTLLQHPFFVGRKGFVDAYGNMSILQTMIEREEAVAAEITLLFADNPEKVDYEIVSSMRMDDEEVVLCDVENIGEMKELKGAIVFDVLIRLESTNAIEQLDDQVYRIRIADCYTRQNPMSWIDVIEFRMGDNVELISYQWNPKSAKGPKIVEENRLLWENFNEPEAPNEYILDLKLPNFRMAGAKGFEVNAFSKFSDGLLQVTLNNVGNEGFFFVRVIGDGIEQTRKVYLNKGESVTLSFVAPEGAKVEIWHEKTLLGEAELVEEDKKETGLKPPGVIVSSIIIMGVVLLFLSFLVGKETRELKEVEETRQETEPLS